MISAIKELNIHFSNDQASGDALGGYFCPHNQDPAAALALLLEKHITIPL